MNNKRVNTTQKKCLSYDRSWRTNSFKLFVSFKIRTCLIWSSWLDRAHYNSNWNTSNPLDSSLTQMSPKFQIEFGAGKFHTDKFNHWNNFTLFSICVDFYVNFFALLKNPSCTVKYVLNNFLFFFASSCISSIPFTVFLPLGVSSNQTTIALLFVNAKENQRDVHP